MVKKAGIVAPCQVVLAAKVRCDKNCLVTRWCPEERTARQLPQSVDGGWAQRAQFGSIDMEDDTGLVGKVIVFSFHALSVDRP